MWYVSSEANKKHRISTFAEFVREIKQSEETNAQRDILAADVGEKSYFSSTRSQHSTEARPHAMTPKEQQKCIKLNKNIKSSLK